MHAGPAVRVGVKEDLTAISFKDPYKYNLKDEWLIEVVGKHAHR
jgi:hypothetical protein